MPRSETDRTQAIADEVSSIYRTKLDSIVIGGKVYLNAKEFAQRMGTVAIVLRKHDWPADQVDIFEALHEALMVAAADAA